MADMVSDKNWKNFASDNPPTFDVSVVQSKVSEFIAYNVDLKRPVVLITSGGTTVPLEHNTVRFVDNFSAGTRGSASAEYFLKSGYAVIFMHRKKSMEPFVRHLDGYSLLKGFSIINEDGNRKIQVSSDTTSKLIPIVEQYKEVSESRRLLPVPFTTVSEYLHLLHIVSCELKRIGSRALLYLAAAVSDFYIPSCDMAKHKIPSTEPLELRLQIVPKLLHPLVRYWVPDAFVVSFKLETDENILLEKARQALDKYGHKIVIANLLETIRTKVVLVTKDTTNTIQITGEEQQMGKEIEEKIVEELIDLHQVML